MRFRNAYNFFEKVKGHYFFQKLNYIEKYAYLSFYITIPTTALFVGTQQTIETYKRHKYDDFVDKTIIMSIVFIGGTSLGCLTGILLSVFWPVMVGVHVYEKTIDTTKDYK